MLQLPFLNTCRKSLVPAVLACLYAASACSGEAVTTIEDLNAALQNTATQEVIIGAGNWNLTEVLATPSNGTSITGAVNADNTPATRITGACAARILATRSSGTIGKLSNLIFTHDASATPFSGKGGAVYTGAITGGLENVQFLNNKVVHQSAANPGVGSALYVEKDFSGDMKNVTFSGNEVRQYATAYIGGTFSGDVENVVFENNSASNKNSNNGNAFGGAGLSVQNGMTSNVKNSVFQNNNSSYNTGGGIDVTGTFTGTVSNTLFKNNTSGQMGAGMTTSYFVGTLDNTQFIGNRTVEDNDYTYGAGFYTLRMTGTITDTLFEENESNFGGGMASVYLMEGDIENTTFRNNIGHIYGGGLYLQNGMDGSIIGSTFEGNKTDDNYIGGGLFATESLGKIDNTKFIRNSAGAGGAIYIASATTQIVNSTFSGNTAAVAGGAIRADSANLRITDSIITGNRAGNRGGFITTNGTLLFTVSDNQTMAMTDNYANGLANVVNFDNQGTLSITAGTGAAIAMHGSITAAVAATARVDVVKNGVGDWFLGGASVFKTQDDSAVASFKVNGGNLHLYGRTETPSGEDATITLGGAKSAFVFGNGKDAMTLSVGGANAITSAGSVLFKANTNILATDSATSLVLGGGDGSAALEGALTLTNDKALQLGAAFASRSAEAGITKRGAGALTLTQADTFRNASFLDLRQGSLASAKNQAFNRLDSAVNTTIAVGGKMTMNEGTLRGRTTAGSFEKNGSGGLTVVGPMTVAGDFALSGGTLNLFLDDRTATINADTATLAPGASLNITGFGSLTEGEECYTAYVPVISTQSGVLSMPDPANVFVAGVTRPICEFMLIRVLTQDDDVVVKYELNWYNEDGETANGLFGIGEKRENSDVSFELGAMLQDRLPGAVDPDNEHGWDGTKLTKGGYGTLILTSNKNRYTGGSFIENGTLVAAAPGALGKEEVELSHQDTTLVLRYDADDFTDASLPTATGNNITGAGRLEIDGNVVYEGDRSGHTGDVAISAGSRFSSGSDETFASNLTMGPGSTMDIDGTFTVTKGSIAGAVTATDMVKQGSDRLIVDGSITLANSLEVSGGLDLMIGDQAPITAPTTTFIDDTILNIRGVSKDGNHRIITSGTINGVLPELLIGGQTPSSDSFLIAGLKQDSDGLYLDTVFAWNHPEFVDDHYHMAHGTFELADDAEFYLNVPLADRDANSKYKDNWDGKTMHKTGAGTLGITCANSFTGGVKIHAGTVNAGCESALGTGAVVIADGARLELEHDGDFSNPLSDSGDVVVRGVQTWLTSPTGIADAYSGTVTVESGSVTLGTTRTNTYETGGTFALAADTALAGNGSIGGLTLASGARVAPGHSVGALTVNGDVVFEAGSIYEVETDPEDEGVADHIMVNGTADLGGATVRHTGIGEEDAYPSVGEWVILTASEGYGDSRFADTVESRYLFLDETLLYEGNDVLLRVGRSGSFSDYAGTPNQLAVANVLDGMDDASSLYNRLLGATDADSMPAAYDQLSGEMHPSLRRLLADSDRDFGFSLMDRASRPGVQDDAFPIWAEGQGFENRANGRAGVAKSRLYGVRATIGAEKTFLGGWLLGGAFRYGNTTFKVDERNSKADVDSFSFGLYAGRDVAMDLGTLRLNLGAAYSYHDIDSERRLTHTLLGQTLEADYKAHAFQAIGDLGFAFFLNRLEVEPYLRLGVHSIRTRGFSERGGDAALSAAGERTTNVSQTLGVRTALPVTERFTARAGAGWIHTYGQKDARSAFRFIDGGDAFSINGVTVPRNAVKVQLGLDINLTSRADLYVGYDGYLGSGTGNHAGRVALQVNF